MSSINREMVQRGQVMLAVDNDSKAQPLQVNTFGELSVAPSGALSEFGEIVVTERTPIIELNSSYGTSLIRDVVRTSGTGYTTAASGEIILGTTTGDGFVLVRSAELARYVPGYEAEIGIGVRVPTQPTGNVVYSWGGRSVNDTDFLKFGYDATGMFIERKRGGVSETKVYQSNWNVDPMDGTGPSGFTLDPSAGNIYQIVYTWYGYGLIKWGLVVPINGGQRFVVVHSEKVPGQTSVETPNFAIDVRVENNGDAYAGAMYLGGRQYSIIGRYVPKTRLTGQYRGSVSTSTTVEPLISFRSKTGFTDRSIKIESYTVKPATEDVIIEFRLDGQLTGASWQTPTNYTTAETALETDISANAITGGIVIAPDYFSAGEANKGQLTNQTLDFDVPENQVITLCARTLSGTGTITSFLRMSEEW